MKAEDIIRQLFSELPKHTNSFTENISVTSLVRAGTTVTAVTSLDHGLSTGDYALVVGAKNPISISSIIQIGGVATVITNEDHNLTYCATEIELTKRVVEIEITGANEANYNGFHRLLDVKNRREFSYLISSSTPSPATGSLFLLQDGLGYNGWNEVTVLDTTTFTYEIDTIPNSPADGTIEARLRPRISGAVTAQAAMNAYTKQFESLPNRTLWGFVVLGDKVANKNRETMSDATSTFGIGAEYRQMVIQPFSVFCIFPATNSIAARKERDDADDLVRPFCKSLLRVKFPTGFTENAFAGVVFSTDRYIAYDSATYVHEYAFETSGWLTYGDTVDPEYSTAFRDINLAFKTNLSQTAGVVMTTKIDLDQEQLT